MVAVAEKVLELASLMRAEAGTIQGYNDGAARGLVAWAERIEAAVNAEGPAWLTVAEVRALKGHSDRYLRRLAARVESEGHARRTPKGYVFAYPYVRAMRVKPAHERALRTDGDLEELGRQLGAEE